MTIHITLCRATMAYARSPTRASVARCQTRATLSALSAVRIVVAALLFLFLFFLFALSVILFYRHALRPFITAAGGRGAICMMSIGAPCQTQAVLSLSGTTAAATADKRPFQIAHKNG